MSELEPLTREETFLNAIAEGQTPSLEPLTREEHFLDAIAKHESPTLTPMTREEYFLNNIATSGGGGGGSSDFTTATLTIAGDVASAYTAIPAEVDEEFVIIDEISGGNSYTVFLYKNKLTFPVYDISPVVVTGNATITQTGAVEMTGDATITWENPK